MSKEQNKRPLFGKHVTASPWGWNDATGTSWQCADVYVNYYLFGILVHSVTVRGASWDVARGLGLPQKYKDR